MFNGLSKEWNTWGCLDCYYHPEADYLAPSEMGYLFMYRYYNRLFLDFMLKNIVPVRSYIIAAQTGL